MTRIKLCYPIEIEQVSQVNFLNWSNVVGALVDISNNVIAYANTSIVKFSSLPASSPRTRKCQFWPM